jgi:hypothetical protein
MANRKPSKARPTRHYAPKPCARCGSQFVPDHSGTRYCSTDCFSEARREYQRLWRRANKQSPTTWPAWVTRGAAREPAERVSGEWRRARRTRRSKTACGVVVSYWHASGRYRVDHYLANRELPYFVLCVTNTTGRDAELIGRFASLEKAQAACKRHGKQQSLVGNGRPYFNELGDPILYFGEHRRKKETE